MSGCGAEGCNIAGEPGLSCSIVRPAQTAGQRQGGIEGTEWTGCPTGLEKGSVEPHGVSRVALRSRVDWSSFKP